MMPKSTPTRCRPGAREDAARVHVGGKKLSRNTWVKKISTPRSPSVFMSTPAATSSSTWSTGMP